MSMLGRWRAYERIEQGAICLESRELASKSIDWSRAASGHMILARIRR